MELPGLNTAWLGRNHLHFDTLNSTNDYLKANAAALPHGTAATAAFQSAGKGRLGRSWAGERGQYLALSFLLHCCPPEHMALLPLVVGLAVSTALEELCHVPFPIKWSNDVLCKLPARELLPHRELLPEREHLPGGELGKLCGILCESRTAGDSSFAVVGIGVNLLQTAGDFARHGLVYAGSLQLATGRSYGFFQVTAQILNRIEPILLELWKNGFDGELRDRYRERCATLGKPVRLLQEGRELEGHALDIDGTGGLICRVEGRERTVNAGEVSVRGIYGYA